MLSRGAELNKRNKDGKTLLSRVIIESNEAAVRYLLGKGADPHF
jgi:ankyrin repeat protein